jgi:hypothetical protein
MEAKFAANRFNVARHGGHPGVARKVFPYRVLRERKPLARFEFCVWQRKGFVNAMRSLRILSGLGLLIVTILACAPNARLLPNPATSEPSPVPLVYSTKGSEHQLQPDLIIPFMYLEMEGRQGYCVDAYSPYGIRVRIKNIGSANSGPFFVDLNGVVQEVKDGLGVDQSLELHFAGTIPSGQYEATADVTDQIVESREDNNTFSFHAPTPTPPPLCVVTGTATP